MHQSSTAADTCAVSLLDGLTFSSDLAGRADLLG
jgi:hypothetical protein